MRTAANILELSATDYPSARNRFRFAVVSDIHDSYDEWSAAVRRINADTSCRFVLVVGDLTRYGLAKEFEWMGGILRGLSAPFFTVIGNHDALANGDKVYRSLFGPWDFSFTYRGVKFVCFNDNAWEFSAVPDWAWLEREWAEAGDSLRIFTVAHIPPFGDQFDDSTGRAWAGRQSRAGVELSIHGHLHNFHFEEYYGDGVPYLTVDDVGSRNFSIVTVSDTGIAVERVFF